MQLKDVGEFQFIHHIESDTIYDGHTIYKGIGDDCAVYKSTDGYDQLISTDTMVEGVHFSFRYMEPYDVGYRLMTANISDIAAMGGIPRQVVLSVAAHEDMSLATLTSIYRGIKDQCKEYKINLIGGDTVRTEGPMVWTVTIVGEVPRGRAILRSCAQPGDIIGVTDSLGLAATGLEALRRGYEDYPISVTVHRRPIPQIELGWTLRQLGVHSMNDISDGLSSELYEIAEASNVSLNIDSEAIPLHEETRRLAKQVGLSPLHYALHGGEDFKLLFTAPKSLEKDLLQLSGVTIIGFVTAGPPEVTMMGADQEAYRLEKKGYNHFHESCY